MAKAPDPKATKKPRRPSDPVPAPQTSPDAPEAHQPPPYTGPVVVMFENVQQWLYTRDLMTVTPHTLTGGQILIHARAIECLNQAVPTETFSRGILDKHYQEKERDAAKEREQLRLKAEAEAYERNKNPQAKPKAANTPGTFKRRS